MITDVAFFSCLIFFIQYHIKMTPGTGKKGKTSKQAIQIFCAMKEALENEIQLMKVSKEEEITRNMVRHEIK